MILGLFQFVNAQDFAAQRIVSALLLGLGHDAPVIAA